MIKKNIEQLILFQIDKTSKVAKQYSQREFDKLDLGITVDQWILVKIIQEEQPISQKEIATKSLRDPSSITRTLNILEQKQLIQREAIPNNKRQYNIILTKRGAAFVKTNMKMITKLRRRSIRGFKSEELELLAAMLQRIQKNMA